MSSSRDRTSESTPHPSSNAIRFWSIGGITIVLTTVIGFATASQFRRDTKLSVSTVRIIATYPHDTRAFTQGLVFVDDHLYEGTGMKGGSSLRRVDLKTGKVQRQVDLDPSYFGEGIAIFDHKVYQLTWQNRIAIVYDQETFQTQRTFRYTGEGWGLTHNGKHLILSDGTSTLRFLDPATFDVVKRVKVHSPTGLVEKLNELEFRKGEILANIWHSDRIARISPEDGSVLGWIDLSTIYPINQRRNREDVLNGIAYDEANDRLFVTGKHWPKLFEIEIVSNR